ncbi:MAG: hypothetical protein ACYDEJ_12550 [Desulfitobacteriaceae bacterium]
MFTDKKDVLRDERTITVENISYSLGYKFIGFALLFDVAYRAFKKGETSWDLFAILILSGALTTAYQFRNKIINKSMAKGFILAVTVASIVALLVVLVITVH